MGPQARPLGPTCLPGAVPIRHARSMGTPNVSNYHSWVSPKKPQRTKLGAMGGYYRAFVVTEDRVTKWPAPRDEVEYDVPRVSVNMHTN